VCGKAATAEYKKAMAEPKFGLSPAFDASALSGKKFAFVGINNNSIIQDKVAGFKEALKTVGADVVFFDGKGRPDVIAQAMQSAIAQDVAGIVTDGFDAAALAKPAVVDAGEANIPVVNTNAYDPSTPLPEGIAANVAPGTVDIGTIEADYLLAKTDCKLHALQVFTSVANMTVEVETAFGKEVKRLCPDDCKVTKMDVNAATYQTDLAPQVQTALQRDASVNAIALGAGDVFAPYAATAVKALGSKALIISYQGSGLKEAIGGDGIVANVLWAPPGVDGYYAADAVMRAASGDPANAQVPIRLADSSNWGDGNIDTLFSGAKQAKDDFKALWQG